MRRLLIPILMLVLATPVAARQQARLDKDAAPTAEQAGLRPGQPAPAAAEAPPLDFSAPGGRSTLPAGLAFTRPLASTAADPAGSRNAAQCRAGCAQSHYFCLSAEDEQTCNPQWSRCVAGCS